jgi:protein SCO1
VKHVSKKAPRKHGFALGLAGLSGLVYAVMPGRADLGSPAIGGSFTMIAQDGRVVTSADLAGRPYLVFFGYTHCPDFCPTALFDISAVFKELGLDEKVAALFIPVDPERDKPGILKAYLENFDSRIIGLTGEDKRGKFVSAFNLQRPPQQAARELEAYL